MGYKSVLAKIDELRTLVGSWESDPAAIEMDMALERVKSIYEMLRFPVDEPQSEEPQAECLAVEPIAEEAAEEAEASIAEPIEDVVAEEPIVEVEDEEEEDDDEIHLELVNVTQIVDEVLESGDTLVVDEPERVVSQDASKKRERLSRILSLYEEHIEEEQHIEEVEEQPQPQVEEPAIEPQAEPQTESQEEQISESKPQETEPEQVQIEPQPQIEVIEVDLNLGLNDRLLLSQDLFDGDESAMMQALGLLYTQPTIDDAMIYIAENYSWSGDSEGAQLLMSLLENHYQN